MTDDLLQKKGVVDNEIITDQQTIEQALGVEVEKEPLQVVTPCLQVIEDLGQRENLFHVRCLIQGKTYKLIVDGGICANVVPREFVKKIQLLVIPHPMPYGLC